MNRDVIVNTAADTNFFNRPLETHESIIAAAVCVLIIVLLILQARRSSTKIAREFRTRHPDAALLCLYVQDTTRTDGRITCRKGTISKLFDSKDAPESGLKHRAVCLVVPGQTELDVTVTFMTSSRLSRRCTMRANFSFSAEPNHGYVALFDPESGGAKLTEQ